MRFIDHRIDHRRRRRHLLIGVSTLALLTACSSPRRSAPIESTPPASRGGRLSNWDDYRIAMGRRLVAANPEATYTGAVPEPLLAIPVLEIDLNRDGSIRAMRVQRAPSQAEDTVQLAMDAVRRAAPFGDVSHLPQPWRVSEVFLFRDDRKFKPRSIDIG